MDYKTEQEWLVIRWFRNHFTDFPKGKLIKDEAPDFRLLVGPKRWIGIEIVQLVMPEVRHTLQVATYLIESVIIAKEMKAPAYRSRGPQELWLIIFTDDLDITNESELAYLEHPGSARPAFDRVFLFNLFRHSVTEMLSLSAQGYRNK